MMLVVKSDSNLHGDLGDLLLSDRSLKTVTTVSGVAGPPQVNIQPGEKQWSKESFHAASAGFAKCTDSDDRLSELYFYAVPK